MTGNFVLDISVDTNGNIYDRCGNVFTDIQNVTTTAGKFTKAIKFDGNSYITIAHNADRNLAPNIDFTLFTWLKYIGKGGGYSTILCRKNDWGSGFSATVSDAPKPYCTIGGRGEGYSQLFSKTGWSYNDGLWHHICVTRHNSVVRLFCDGIKKAEDTISYDFIGSSSTLGTNIGFDGVQSNSWLSAYIENLALISGEALWIDNFTPPNYPITKPSQIYVKDNYVYGMSNRVFSQLSSDYSSMSDAEKIALFSTLTEDASISDLSTLNRFKVVSYHEGSSPVSCVLSAIPKDQLVLPNSLISLKSMPEILSIKITEDKTVSTDSDIKYAFTTDLTIYKAYNPVTLQWDIINVDNLLSEGMSASTIFGLSKDNIADFLGDSKEIGIGFVMYSTSTSNTISIDNLSITANMAGSWDKAMFGTDYKYGYPANDELSVTLLTNGDFKINYSEG